MSKETRLLRASVPFLAFSLVFAEGLGRAVGLLAVAGVAVLSALAWLSSKRSARDNKAERPLTPPELRPPA